MNVSRSATGSADSSRRTSPAASARRTLRRISWRSFLPRRVEVASSSAAVARERRHRADVLALDVEGPALGDLARAERSGQRVGGRVAAAQPPQVHDVPGHRVRVGAIGWRGQVGDDGLGDRRQVAPARPGPSRSRRGRSRRRRRPWRAAPRASAVGRSSARIRVCVIRSVASTSWRCMSGTIATGAAHRPAPPGRRRRASARGRSRRRRPTTPDGTPSARTAWPTASAPPGRPRSRASSASKGRRSARSGVAVVVGWWLRQASARRQGRPGRWSPASRCRDRPAPRPRWGWSRAARIAPVAAG